MSNTEYVNIDTLTTMLKQQDAEQMNFYKRVTIFFAVLAPIYFLTVVYLLTKRFDETAKIFAFNQFCFFAMFSIFFIFFRKNYIKLKNTDYSLPILEVFKSAMKRYKFWNDEKWIIFTTIILLDITIINRFAEGYKLHDILITQLIYFSVIGLGMLIRYIIWRSKYKLFITGIDTIIKDIEKG